MTVYMIRRRIADPTDFNLQQATAALPNNDRAGLWAVLSQGIHYEGLGPNDPKRYGTNHSSCPCNSEPPAGRRIKNRPSPTRSKHCFGHVILRMTSGCLKYHRICEALRTDDDEVVLLLLQGRASPSRREEGSNDPIFIAIQRNSAANLRRLLQYSADPRSREAVPSREGYAGRRRLRRRTAIEVAAAYPQCQ